MSFKGLGYLQDIDSQCLIVSFVKEIKEVVARLVFYHLFNFKYFYKKIKANVLKF